MSTNTGTGALSREKGTHSTQEKKRQPSSARDSVRRSRVCVRERTKEQSKKERETNKNQDNKLSETNGRYLSMRRSVGIMYFEVHIFCVDREMM